MRLSLIILLVFASFQAVSSLTIYKKANQTLHQVINSDPIGSLVLRPPQFNKATRYGIVLLVISASYEKAERSEIRRLWAAVDESTMQKDGKSLVIFLVGRSSELEEEASTHGDLLQVDIEETYRNLVYKIEAGFRWVKEKIQSDFVAKIDSDTVVHIDRLYNHLRRYETEQSGQHWIACSTYSNARPIRDDTSYWYVPYSDYSSYYYPTYCNGPGYVMPRSAFDKIVVNMGKYTVLEVEDVFFTGVVRADLDIFLTDRGITSTQYTEYSNCDSNGPVLSILNTHHQFGWSNKYKKDLTAAWERLKTPYCYNRFARYLHLV